MNTLPICPNCHHEVSKHSDFYCLVPNCKCNLPASTAEARYWALKFGKQVYSLQVEIDLNFIAETMEREKELIDKLQQAREALEKIHNNKVIDENFKEYISFVWLESGDALHQLDENNATITDIHLYDHALSDDEILNEYKKPK